MKSVSTIKSSKTDSPKTPGGISRSLLTPCRRLGLSRNFRKTGTSPFQSPVSSNTEVKREKAETRKRKESLEETSEASENIDECSTPPVTLVQTPTRNVVLPHRKKSKTLLASINKSSEETELQEKVDVDDNNVKGKCCKGKDTNNVDVKNKTVVSTPIRLKSKRRSKQVSPSFSIAIESNTVNTEKDNPSEIPASVEIKENIEIGNVQLEIKEKSPNNLTKECIVVIQKKIFKNELKDMSNTCENKEKPQNRTQTPKNVVSQAVDSDSDDVPLICLSGKVTENIPTLLNNPDDNDDFVTNKAKINKHDNKKSSKAKLKSPASNKNKNNSKVINLEIHNQPNSQSSVEDDDDFFEKKRTILIRKSYNKEMKPQKAKSTGSITQKDIDDLKSRIEMKKKLLLAKAMTEDTKELRDLIKKWQKGCQDALMELMDLMKNKFSDKQNMDYSEILQTLKIPASLVGYDSDNDCFLTPDDESIILANVKH